MAAKTLQELLDAELGSNDETPEDVEAIAIAGRRGPVAMVTYDDLADYEGNTGYGSASLPRLHAWTGDRVYFKNVYDGSETVLSVPRDPTDEQPGYYGGG